MDFTGRMTSLTDIDGSVFAYEFDGEGNRLSQSLNDCLSKRFVYDGADVLLELNPTNGVAYAWVNGPGIDQPIERLLFIDGEPRARRVFHSDALGSVAALTDPSGLVTQTYAYSAFGSLRSSTGHDPNRVTFTGREQLGDALNMMYFRHRIYLAGIGRFLASDPLGFVDGVNVFSLVNNTPATWTDPWGLEIYRVRRKLGTAYLRNPGFWYAHEFLVETKNGVLVATYSWGTDSCCGGSWGKNNEQDRKSIKGIESFANDSRFVLLIEGDDYNEIFEQEFERIRQKSKKHPNLGVAFNCKTEAASLIRHVREKINEMKYPELYEPVYW